MPLFHFEVGFPAGLSFTPLFNLTPSVHAKQESVKDFRGIITLPKHFLPRTSKVIEVETDWKGELVKILARQPHDDKNDVVFAISVKNKVIKTAWLQNKDDLHKTLDRSKYNIPKKV